MATKTVTPEVRLAEKKITQEIKAEETKLRKEYSFLNYQDLIGTLIFLASFAGIFACYQYYWSNRGSVFEGIVAAIGIAIFTSFLHELEHDLIHNLYWKKFTPFQDVMFFFIMLSKLHSNPWYRREMHLKHHIVSGQTDDAEERLIGLGLPFGLGRIAATIHPFAALILTPSVAKDAPWLNVQRMNLTSAPVAFFFMGLQKAFMLYAIGFIFFPGSYMNYLPMQYWELIRDLNVIIVFPNNWRQFSLVLMSNCSHYYGDIPEKSVFYQNQILNHWVFHIFQVFCCHFGATHIVHHYVPGQPFYIRHLVYLRVKEFMKEHGCRENDMGIVYRGNRYFSVDVKKNDGDVSLDKMSSKKSLDCHCGHLSAFALGVYLTSLLINL